jgi:acyl-CoA synthetase (AMP-forming)/AMP-acid ligase II
MRTSPRCGPEGDRLFSFMPMYHQGGLLVHWLPAYILGSPFYQMERFSPRPFWATVKRYHLTTGLFMPPVPAYLLARDDDDHVGHTIEWAFGISPPDVWKQFQERFGVPLHGGYGSTETTMVGMTGFRDDPPYPGEELDLPLGGSVMGKPIPDWCELRIADPDDQPLPPLTFGEVQVRGPGVLTEYYRNPQATAAAFTSDGWFKSGDIGYRTEDGRYLLVDRTKNLIRRSGENIAPAEIEEVLNEHPGIAEAAVVPVEDDIRGQEIRACIVRAAGAELTAEDVFDHCAAQLAPFKVPRYVEFLDELPHTPTFKIQKEPLVQDGDRTRWVDRLGRGRARA